MPWTLLWTECLPTLLALGRCDRPRTSESPKPGKARNTMPATMAEAASGAVRTRPRLDSGNPAIHRPAERGGRPELPGSAEPPSPVAVPGWRPEVPDTAAMPGPATDGGSAGILSSAKTGVAMRSGTTSAAAVTAGLAGVSALNPDARG